MGSPQCVWGWHVIHPVKQQKLHSCHQIDSVAAHKSGGLGAPPYSGFNTSTPLPTILLAGGLSLWLPWLTALPLAQTMPVHPV